MIQNAVLTIFVYFTIAAFMVASVRYIEGFVNFQGPHRSNISYFEIILFSLAFTGFDVLMTNISEYNNLFGGYGGDRANYCFSFVHERSSAWGLDLLYDLARAFSLDFPSVLYCVMFICCILTFFAFRKMEDATPLALAIFLSTDAVFFMLSQLKQCFANSFACIFFAYILKEQNKKNDLICLIAAFLASYFHPTGCILFLLYFVLKYVRNNKNGLIYVLIFSIATMPFLEYLLLFFVKFFSFLPYISSKISQYFFEQDVDSSGDSKIVFLKGLAFYVITIYGAVRRKNFIDCIRNYDMYLIISIYGSAFYFLSFVSYWMNRYTSLFYLPMIVFFCLLIRNEKNAFTRYSMILLIFLCILVVRIRHIFLMYINFGGY